MPTRRSRATSVAYDTKGETPMKKALSLIAIFVLAALSTAAQKQQLTSKMVYHNGPVLTGSRNIYMIYYGCWTNNCGSLGDTQTQELLTEFSIYLGNSPYAQINSSYTDASGQPVASSFIFGGLVVDGSYSHGTDLTPSDMVDLISQQVNS